jgi:hypothetical protein
MPTGDSINSLSDIHRILSLCGGSRSGSRSRVTLEDSSGQMNVISSRGSVNRIEIPSSIEIISLDKFYSCSSLTEIQLDRIVMPRRFVDFPGAGHSGKSKFHHWLRSFLLQPSLNAFCLGWWSFRETVVRERIWVSEDAMC